MQALRRPCTTRAIALGVYYTTPKHWSIRQICAFDSYESCDFGNIYIYIYLFIVPFRLLIVAIMQAIGSYTRV